MSAVFDYSIEHPHYTPGWLSELLAMQIPIGFRGTIVDPACGAGNLLAAAALVVRKRQESMREIRFVGFDVSDTAVASCKRALSALIKEAEFCVVKADFLKVEDAGSLEEQKIVIMNPPFMGYGLIHPSERREISETLGLRGRFNLSHAFVKKAAELLQPSMIIALLPSNWFYSQASSFSEELRKLGGDWKWTDVGDAVFSGVSTHVGLLVWNREGVGHLAVALKSPAKANLEVRQGVATGRDWVFRELAKLRLPFGRVVPSVVGRDISRDRSTRTWMPPKRTFSGAELQRLRKKIPERLIEELSSRACVRSHGRSLFEYHETIPSWFFKFPKVLIPEIVNGDLRVEFDSMGCKLPLHSVFAIRVDSIEQGKKVVAHLASPTELKKLREGSAKLSGGAVRLSVHLIRQSIEALSSTTFSN